MDGYDPQSADPLPDEELLDNQGYFETLIATDALPEEPTEYMPFDEETLEEDKDRLYATVEERGFPKQMKEGIATAISELQRYGRDQAFRKINSLHDSTPEDENELADTIELKDEVFRNK